MATTPKPRPPPPPSSGSDGYDFVANRPPKKRTNLLESIGHLIKGCLGGGILGIHEAFKKTGLWSALICCILFGLYVAYSVHTLVRSAQMLYGRLRLCTMSYPDVAENALANGPFPNLRKYSKCLRYSLDVIICIDLFGSCCVYMIIIAKTIKQLVEHTHESTIEGNPNLRVYIAALLLPLVLLNMITSLKFLAPFTLVADALIVICVGSTIGYGVERAPPISQRPGWKNTIGFFEFCGVAVFSMGGIGVCMPIENNMENPRKFPFVILGGYSLVVTFVILVGFFGYWGFGETAMSPVTLNFSLDTFPIVLKFLMAVMIFITFALNFWAPFNLVWHYISKRHPENKHWFWERVYRTIIIIIITLFAIAFPNIGNLMGLLGAFCLSNMAFTFPAVIELLVIWETPGLGKLKWRLWKGLFMFTLGVLLMIAGTFANVKGLLKL